MLATDSNGKFRKRRSIEHAGQRAQLKLSLKHFASIAPRMLLIVDLGIHLIT